MSNWLSAVRPTPSSIQTLGQTRRETPRQTGVAHALAVAPWGQVGIPIQKQQGEDMWPRQSSPGAPNMRRAESLTDSFIVKVWLEGLAEEIGGATWRGHITHVPSGRRRYLRDLEGVTAFIAPYLERMGVRLGLRWRLRRWLRHRGRRP